MSMLTMARVRGQRDERSFLLQRAMTGDDRPARRLAVDARADLRRRVRLHAFISITLGGAIIATISAALGALS